MIGPVLPAVVGHQHGAALAGQIKVAAGSLAEAVVMDFVGRRLGGGPGLAAIGGREKPAVGAPTAKAVRRTSRKCTLRKTVSRFLPSSWCDQVRPPSVVARMTPSWPTAPRPCWRVGKQDTPVVSRARVGTGLWVHVRPLSREMTTWLGDRRRPRAGVSPVLTISSSRGAGGRSGAESSEDSPGAAEDNAGSIIISSAASKVERGNQARAGC